MIQSTRLPGTIAFTPDVCKPRMLWLTMFAPASPKPSASRDPSLMIVFSNMAVSNGCCMPLSAHGRDWLSLSHRSISQDKVLCLCLWSLCCFAIWNSNSASAIFIAMSGSFAMVFTFSTIRSTGFSTREFASFEKKRVLMQSTTQMKNVAPKLILDSSLTKGLASKKKTKCQSSNWLLVMSCGWTLFFSCGRRSSGHLTRCPTTPSISRSNREMPRCSRPA
mmetsp:Transcript_118832/g.369285  ORF Transcript_118832/g.369285 Transcript_118832/m.369285 type:complete len:221 (-) Transcript_118832:1556-2218(-)